jgi:large subunit ribosomal protein L21
MYAVIVTGGKQYKVSAGDVIQVEKLALEPGTKTEFPVIFLADGEKVVSGKEAEGLKAKAEIVGLIKSDKIIVYKYKAKKNVRKKQGHRQRYTQVKITSIG